MARKLLTSLRARLADGKVTLTAYKSTPAFTDAGGDSFRTIRVFRRIEPGFKFGSDYAEFFDGLSHEDAGLLFEGALEAGNNRKFTVEDADVKTGCTYSLVGAVHAGESGPELILPVLRQLLTSQPELLQRVSIAAIPVTNTGERERLARGIPWYLRTNANGVDLNRNFPADWDTVDYNYGLDTSDPDSMTYRGQVASSEPETQAVMAFVREQKPVVVFAHHCLASICGAHFLAPKCAQTDTEMAPGFKTFADALGRGMAPEFEDAGFFAYGTSAGSLPTWCYRELGVPAFDIEMSGREKEALNKCRADLTDRALLAEYQQRHLKGVTALLETIARG